LRITRDMQSICATYNWSQLARTGINVTNICHTYMSHTYDLYKSYMCVIYVWHIYPCGLTVSPQGCIVWYAVACCSSVLQ